MSEHQQRAAAAVANRPPMRPDPRPESLIRAEQRAREIRKTQTTATAPDILNLSADLAPEGWEYQLKRKEIFGQPDVKHEKALAFGGWDHVPADRHPETYIPPDCALMEKPKQLVEEERYIENQKTSEVMRGQRHKLAEAPPGTLPRDGHAALKPKLTTNYAPMEVRDE